MVKLWRILQTAYAEPYAQVFHRTEEEQQWQKLQRLQLDEMKKKVKAAYMKQKILTQSGERVAYPGDLEVIFALKHFGI